MAERMNGGPWVVAAGQTLPFWYRWGNPGNDAGSRYGLGWPTDNGGTIVSFDQRVIHQRAEDGGGTIYWVTVRNDGPLAIPVDIYAASI